MSGMGGAVALDYVPLFMRMDRLRLSDDRWERLFADVRVIEASALETIKARSTDGK